LTNVTWLGTVFTYQGRVLMELLRFVRHLSTSVHYREIGSSTFVKIPSILTLHSLHNTAVSCNFFFFLYSHLSRLAFNFTEILVNTSSYLISYKFVEITLIETLKKKSQIFYNDTKCIIINSRLLL
jgi:hypothetical protein